jgi:uncharacterized protein YndB with AHSA1/START domain
VAVGVAYGLLFRIVFGLERFERVFGVMTVAFLFFVPAALGYLTVAIGERGGPSSWTARLLAPPATALLALFAALVLAWEGLICIVLWLPLTVVMAVIGALLAVIVGTLVRRRRAQASIACLVALLPLAVAPAEHRITSPDEVRTVRTSIDIAADPATVWRAISRVRRFEATEHRFSWSHLIGFPLPVEATLDREGVGGVRHASFEGGVVFVERVNVWEPGKRLAFTVHADPDAIPMRTLDRHVTVGGEFFDVLEGEYRIEPLSPTAVRLHLASRHRLSTRFNLYSRRWTDWVMTDIQDYILARLKERCERREP